MNDRPRAARHTWWRLAVLPVVFVAGCGFFASPAERIAKADALIAKGDYRTAVIELKNALDKEPDNAQARLKLGQVSLALGDVQSAIKELERAVELGADRKQAAPPLLRAYLAANQAQKVVDLLSAGDTAAAIGPAEAARFRGDGLIALGRGEEAEAAYRESLKAGGAPGDAGAGVVRALLAQGKVEAARAELDSLSKDAAGEANLLMLQSEFAARAGDLPGAEKKLAEALKTRDVAGDTLLRVRLLAGITELQLTQRNFSQARQTLGDLVKVTGESPLYNLLRGRVDFADGKVKDAIGRFQAFNRDIPDSLQGKVLLGAAYLAEGSVAQALGQLESALAMAPASAQARLLLAQAQLQDGKPKDVLATLAPLLAANPPSTQAVILAGRARIAAGDAAEGIDLLRQNAAANPDDAALQFELATSYIAAGQQDKALAVLGALKSTGNDARRREWLTVLAQAGKGDLKAADAVLGKLLAANPKNAELLNLAGAYYRNTNRRTEAVRTYEQALAADPKSVGALIALAQLSVASGDDRAAHNYLNRVLAIDPVNGTALDGLARFALAEQNADAAVAILEQARAKDPKAIPPRVLLVRWLGIAGRPDDAVNAARELLTIAPGDARVAGEAAAAFVRAGKYQEALAQYNAAIRLGGTPDLLLARGGVEAQLKNLPAARQTFEQALAANPDWPPAVAGLLRIDVAEGKTDAALARARAVAQKYPNNAQAQYLEGEVLAMSGKFVEAAAYYDGLVAKGDNQAVLRAFQMRTAARLPNPEAGLLDLLAKHPNNNTVRGVLATWYQSTGRIDQARTQYEEVLKRNANDAVVLNNLGWMLGAKGDPKGLEYARRAFELAPRQPAITDTYGWLLARAGQIKEAMPLLKRAANLAPGDQAIQYHYAFVLARTDDRAQAKVVLAKALASKQAFDGRADAEKLAAELK